MEKLDLHTPDFVSENIEKLASLFPHCVTETAEGKKIDFDLLQQELSDDIVEGNRERYRLEWPGKREAIVTANLPTTKTLRPVREDSVDFDNTENLYIEGDNLEVLKLLQESYFGKIKMIYIDPPYNTGNDFVYKDNFSMVNGEWSIVNSEKDEYGTRLVANPESSGRYHSDWLTMMYPRLKLARNLLTDDGVIFISIDDNEVHNLRKVCDEVFGEVNFVTVFIWEKKKKPSFLNQNVGSKFEYILVYSKNKNFSHEFSVETTTEGKKYPFNNAGNSPQVLIFPPKSVKFLNILDGKIEAQEMSAGNIKTKLLNDIEISEGKNVNEIHLWGEWRYSQSKLNELLEENSEITISTIPFRPNLTKKGGEIKKMHNFLTIDHYNIATNEDGTKEFIEIMGAPFFDYTKPEKLIELLIRSYSWNSKESIILDFFSGSATTAHSVMQLNAEDGGIRKYIMVQLPELTDKNSEAIKAGYHNICEIGKERIRRAAIKVKEEKLAKAQKDGMFANIDDKQDYGFRVYSLDTSNMQDVYYRPQDYKQDNLDLFADNIKPDRTADDLLAQVMLDWGLPLSYKIEQATINGKQVFRVAQDSLLACFDKGIDEDFAKIIAKEKPLRIVFRDSGFANDTSKINVQQLLKQLSPETEMKVI